MAYLFRRLICAIIRFGAHSKLSVVTKGCVCVCVCVCVHAYEVSLCLNWYGSKYHEDDKVTQKNQGKVRGIEWVEGSDLRTRRCECFARHPIPVISTRCEGSRMRLLRQSSGGNRSEYGCGCSCYCGVVVMVMVVVLWSKRDGVHQCVVVRLGG